MSGCDQGSLQLSYLMRGTIWQMKKGSLDRRRLEASSRRVRTGVLPASRLKNWPATGSSSGFWQPRKPGVCGRAWGKDEEGVGAEIRGPRAELGRGVLAVSVLLGSSPDLGEF